MRDIGWHHAWAQGRKMRERPGVDTSSHEGAERCHDRGNAVPRSTSPRDNGPPPFAQASVKTGSMTYQVRNKARLTMSMFGGACCRPIACLRIDRTVTTKGKHVTITARPGARLRTDSRRKSWTVRAVTVVPSPNPSVRSCAWGAAQADNADEQKRKRKRHSQSAAQVGHFDQTDSKLPGLIRPQALQLARAISLSPM